jgi:ribonucleoside-diphosphate reductase alpha chain
MSNSANPGRQRLPNRRHSESFNFDCNGIRYCCTISRFPDGRLAEIFISNAKAGSHSDAAAKDAAVVASIAFQYRVPVDVMRHSLLRDPSGRPSSPLGAWSASHDRQSMRDRTARRARAD